MPLIDEKLKRMPRTIRVGIVPGGLSEFINIQAAINYCDNEGGVWVIEIHPGAYLEGDITPNGGATITLRGIGVERAIIAPVAVPAAAVIVSGFNLTLDNLIVAAPTNARPALRVTGGTCHAASSTLAGVGAGNSIEQVAGDLTLDACRVPADIDLSTANCDLYINYSLIEGGIDTADALAHRMWIKESDFNNSNLNSAATGNTLLFMEGCSYVGIVTNAGTRPFEIRDSDIAEINATATGTFTIYGGFVNRITRAAASVVWWQDENTLKVIPSATNTDTVIQYAINAALAGDVILLHPGTYQEQVTCVAGVDIRGIGSRGSAVISQIDARVIILADNVELKNFTVRLVTPTDARQLVYDNAVACTALLEDIDFEITTPGAFNHALMRFYGAGTYTVRGCFANIGACGANFYTIEQGQNAGVVYLSQNDFTAATGYHLLSSVAGTWRGGLNRWAGTCGLFNVTAGDILLDNDAKVCTGANSRTGGTVFFNTAAEATIVVAASNCLSIDAANLICDGTADEVEIQAAIDALPAGGGRVVLSEGAFTTAASIVLKSSRELVGQGIHKTRIAPIAGATNFSVIKNDVTGVTWYCRIAHLTVEMGTSPAERDARASGHGIEINTAQANFVKIDHVRAWYCKQDGIFIDFGYQRRISFCSVQYNAGRGIYSGANVANGTMIDHSVIESNIDANIQISAGSGHKITDNTLEYGAISIWLSGCYNSFVAGNSINTASARGIHVAGLTNTILGNVILNSTTQGIYMETANNRIIANQVENSGQHGIQTSAASRGCEIIGNVVVGSGYQGIRVTGVAGDSRHVITGNIVRDPTAAYAGIQVDNGADRNVICNNICVDTRVGAARRQNYGIAIYSNNNTVAHNILHNNTVANLYSEPDNIFSTQFSDLFMDVLAASTNHCGSWAGTGAEQVIVAGITQPDVPRNLTVTATNVGPPSGDVVIVGIDAKGNTVSETFAIVAGGTRTGNVAFASITSITIPATVPAGDTIDVGIGSKLGLSNVIYATGDVYKVRKNNDGNWLASSTVNATYHTVDVSTGGAINAGDDFAVWFRSNLNIIS